MQLSISGHHVDNSKSIEEYVEENLSSATDKYSLKDLKADVVFSKGKNNFFKTLVIINQKIELGAVLKATCEAGDIYSSFDAALKKLIIQLKKYKEKKRGHNRRQCIKAKLYG